jgi:hypothetical protein
MSDRTIQNIFKSNADYLAATPQPLKNRKAIYAIGNCRTPDMGISYFSCKSHHETIEQYHSCRNRSCFICGEKAKLEWIESEKKRLLNLPHFHVIFTLPHEYLNVWRYNEALFADILFKASQQTLFELMRDPKYHGVTPGLMVALHTWGRQLNLHPHVHCLITAGGINKGGEWKDTHQFLLPVRAVKKLYRGKIQGALYRALQDKTLKLPPNMTTQQFFKRYRAAGQKSWSVRIEDRYEHGKGVMLYLSRYLKSGPLNPKQLTYQGRKGFSLRYLDHRDHRKKQLHLSEHELLKRLLTHVPPVGVHTVRHYGLYSTSCKARKFETFKRIETLLTAKIKSSVTYKDMVLLCQTCGEQAYLTFCLWMGKSKAQPNRHDLKAFSINKVHDNRDVQQGDDADIAKEILGRSSSFSNS